MTTQLPPCDEPQPIELGPAPKPLPEEFAVSPGIGPAPAIYVPRSPGRTSSWVVVQRAVTGTERLIRRGTSGLRARVSMRGTTPPDVPADPRYRKAPLWASPSDAAGLMRVGVTDVAQQSIGDVIDVTLPVPGDTVRAGEACGDIRSVTSASDLIAPVTGIVRNRNDELTGSPELVNTDQYGRGWLFEVEIGPPATTTQPLASPMEIRAHRELAGA